jgi:hypothetical protein
MRIVRIEAERKRIGFTQKGLDIESPVDQGDDGETEEISDDSMVNDEQLLEFDEAAEVDDTSADEIDDEQDPDAEELTE